MPGGGRKAALVEAQGVLRPNKEEGDKKNLKKVLDKTGIVRNGSGMAIVWMVAGVVL